MDPSDGSRRGRSAAGIIAPPSPPRISGAALVVAGCCAVLATGAFGEDADNAAALEALRERIGGVQQRIDQDRDQQGEALRELERAERRLVRLAGELSQVRHELERTAKRLEQTAAEHQRAREALGDHRRALGRQVRAAYVIGQNGRAKLLLSQDGTQRLSRTLTHYDFLNRARADRIRGVQGQVEQLAAAALKLQEDTEALESTRQKRERTRRALEAAQAERLNQVDLLRTRIAGREDELRQLRHEEQDLERLLREVQQALAEVPAVQLDRPFRNLKGELPWPASGGLLADFGQPKVGGTFKWNGLWIDGAEGDGFRAIATGRVAYVGWMHRYGLIVVLEHEGGYYSLYGHSQAVHVLVGDRVLAGEVIGLIGNTGGHSRPGLYFELRKGTKPINPVAWLARTPT